MLLRIKLVTVNTQPWHFLEKFKDCLLKGFLVWKKFLLLEQSDAQHFAFKCTLFLSNNQMKGTSKCIDTVHLIIWFWVTSFWGLASYSVNKRFVLEQPLDLASCTLSILYCRKLYLKAVALGELTTTTTITTNPASSLILLRSYCSYLHRYFLEL